MKVKKIPMRTCVVTHEKLEKKDLLRIVRNNIGELFVDETGKQNGRGAYIKKETLATDIIKKESLTDKYVLNDITVYLDVSKN